MNTHLLKMDYGQPEEEMRQLMYFRHGQVVH